MAIEVYVNGALETDLKANWLRRSYIDPWSCELSCAGRHDQDGGAVIGLYDWVELRDSETGRVLFRGNAVQASPGGVEAEGIRWLCKDRRCRLAEEIVRVNGSASYVWNRRGFRCNASGGEDSPGRDGGKWTVGEICIDILEHALGIPAAGSDIDGHHPDASCVTDTYLTGLDIVGYDAADWLAVDSAIGEFGVSETTVAEALEMLLGLAGGMWGWYIDETGVLRLHDLSALPTTDLAAGQTGHWQDEVGKDYMLLGNRVDWSLEGVYSEVVVQGTDMTVEVKPSNIEASGNAALNGGGELELVDAPWRGYPCAYRALLQPYRHWTSRRVGTDGSCEGGGAECGVPDNVVSITWGPRIYRGTDAGAKTYLVRLVPGGRWVLSLATGILMFYYVPALGPGEKLWGWYWARRPFTAGAGPGGTAYNCYGYERTLWVFDPAYRHTSSYPASGDADEVAEMETLAARLLEQHKDVRLQGALRCDLADPFGIDLTYRYNVTNLTAPAIGGCDPDPMDWSEVALNAVEVFYDFEANLTEITVANTLFMLEGYSELKRRLYVNQEIRTARDLAEDTLDCQVAESAQEEGASYPTSTHAPVTTTTQVPGSTTTGPPPETTTPAPPGPTTTPLCDDCRDLADLCFRLDFDGPCCGIAYGGCSAKVEWLASASGPDGVQCWWQGDLVCAGATTTPAPATTTEMDYGEPPGDVVELIFHPVAGWMIVHGENAWLKDAGGTDPCDPAGTYSCVCGDAGSVTVIETFCGTTTEAPTTTTEAPPTTTPAPVVPTTTEAPPDACPDDCDACIENTVTIAGCAGSVAALNGVHTVTRTGCDWAKLVPASIWIQLGCDRVWTSCSPAPNKWSCQGAKWFMGPMQWWYFCHWSMANTDNCPGGNYVLDVIAGCNNDVGCCATISVS